jgi:hypothetical protein
MRYGQSAFVCRLSSVDCGRHIDNAGMDKQIFPFHASDYRRSAYLREAATVTCLFANSDSVLVAKSVSH